MTPGTMVSGMVIGCFEKWRDLFVLGILFVAVFVLYREALTGGWCCDDPQILKHAIQYSPVEYFFVPVAWRALIGSSFTPWLSLVYDIDFFLFGFKSVGFHFHALATMGLSAFLLYMVTRCWLKWWVAAASALLFLVGTPMAVAAEQLMVRHYTEGLMFYLLSLLLFIRGLEGDSRFYQGLAAVSFGISVSAKELFFPLGLVPFVLPMATGKARLRAAWAYLLVMVAYLAWRWFMLGEVVGGYTPVGAMERADIARVLAQFAAIPGLLFVDPAVWLAGFVVVAGAFQAGLAGRWQRVLVPSFILMLLLAPLLPLGRYPGIGAGSERYFTALWASTAIGFGAVISWLASKRTVWVQVIWLSALVLLAAGAWPKTRVLLSGLRISSLEQDVQGQALVSSTDHDVIYLTTEVPRWFATALMDMRPLMGMHGPPASWVSDESQLVRVSLSQNHVLHYDTDSHVMAQITSSVPARLASWRQKLLEVPLTVELEVNGPEKTVSWRLGPYSNGIYSHLNSKGKIAVTQSGKLRIANPLGDCFRFRYDAPTGWSAYTPPLSLPPEDSQGITSLRWSGKSENREQVGLTDCTGKDSSTNH